MINIQSFIFNPFQENTYVLYDETKECVIIDPGCFAPQEKDELTSFISGQKLKPVALINTHCHIDHMVGNKFIKELYNIPFLMHPTDLPILQAAPEIGKKYGIFIEHSPQPDTLLAEGDEVRFGHSSLKVLFTPGHSPGSVSFYDAKNNFLISGDVLFQGSIGRYDFAGGDYKTLLESITNKLLVLPPETKVYSGHGGVTTIGKEKRTNPFVLEYEEMRK